MFDPKCYELAEYFLADNGAATEEHKSDLAQAIQDAVEDFHAPWAKTEAGYAHVNSMVARADDPVRLMWHGWALREAFVAGAEWQERRKS